MAGEAIHPWMVVTVLLGLVTLLFLLLAFGRRGYDDPYITFRYARNLLAGQGFVYNAGQRTLSTTAPFYGLVLAGLGLIWSQLPALGNALSAVCLVLAAGFLVVLARGNGEPAAGLIAGLLLSLSPLLIPTFGSETCLYVALLLAGLYAYDRSRAGFAALALGGAAMIRPDGILAALVMAAWHGAHRRPIPWKPVFLYLVLVGTFYGALWLYFGSPIPVTLLAKQHQGQMAVSTRFLAGALELARGYGRLPFGWLHGALAIAGLGRILLCARYWLPLLWWAALYLLAYSVLGVTSYFWYYGPLIPALVVAVGEGCVALARLLPRIRLPRPAVQGITGLVVIALLTPLLLGTVPTAWANDSRLEIYQRIGRWLNENTLPEATIGALEVGIIGYYAERTMIDFAGLIQPAVARQLHKGSTYQDAAVWAIQTYQPDYVALQPDAFAAVTESDWFATAYEPACDFNNGQTLWITVYRARQQP